MSTLTHDTRALAETYDRVSDSQLASGERLVERLGVKPGSKVLDVGCGTGRLTRWLAETVGAQSVIGIDPLDERVAIARAHAPAIRFEVAQAEDLSSFGDDSFDVVCMSSVFHWVSDKAKALAEVRRVLRVGGRFGATTLPRELTGASTVSTALRAILQRAPYADKVDKSVFDGANRWATTTEIITLLLESRLELAELHVMQRTSNFESGAALVEFLESSSFGNFARVVAEESRAALRADLAAALDAQAQEGAGGGVGVGVGEEGVTLRDWGMAFAARK